MVQVNCVFMCVSVINLNFTAPITHSAPRRISDSVHRQHVEGKAGCLCDLSAWEGLSAKGSVSEEVCRCHHEL